MTLGKVHLHPDKDGVDHVNVYTRGKTSLGRSLSNLADISLVHPEHGEFRTLEGLYFWRATGMRNDLLRKVNGYDARTIGHKIEKVWDDDFQLDVKIGLAAKIIQNPDLMEALKTRYTDLPFHHYYFYGKGSDVKVVAPKGHKWQMDTIELIRSTLLDPPDTFELDQLLTKEFYIQQ